MYKNEGREGNNLSDFVDQSLVDGVSQLHASVERVLLVVVDQIDQALERRSFDGEEATFLSGATVLDLAFRPDYTQQFSTCTVSFTQCARMIVRLTGTRLRTVTTRRRSSWSLVAFARGTRRRGECDTTCLPPGRAPRWRDTT